MTRPARARVDDDEETVDPPLATERGFAGDEESGLEIFDEAGELDLVTYFYRLPNDGEPAGERHGYCHKILGVVDPELLKSELGGGRYRVIRKQGGQITGRRMVIRIAGPPKLAPPPPPAAPIADYAVAAPTGPIADVQAQLSKLSSQVAELAAPRASRIDDLVALANVAKIMAPQPQASPLNETLGLVEKSFEAGRRIGASGNGGGDDNVSIAREVIQGIVQVMGARRGLRSSAAPTAAPSGPRAPSAASSASVAREPVELDTSDDLVKLVVRAYMKGLSPEDCADTVEDLLSDEELGLLRAAPVPLVVDRLRASTPKATPEARADLDAYASQVVELVKKPETEGAS